MPVKDLVKLTALLAGSNVLTKLAAMGFVVLLAKATSVQDFGTFRYLLTLSFLCALFVTGVATPLTRSVGAHTGEPEAVASYFGGALAITVPSFAVVALVISATSANPVLLTLLLYTATVDTLYIAYVRGLLSRGKMAGYKLLANLTLVALLAGGYLVFHRIALVWVVLLYSLAGTCSLVALECSERTIHLPRQGVLSKARELINFSVLATIANIGTTVMFTINTLWINRFGGKEQVAYYGVAESVAVVFTLLPEAVAAIAIPKAAALKDRSAVGGSLLWVTAGCAVGSLVLLAPLFLFQRFLISTLFTDAYLPAMQFTLPLALANTAVGLHLVYSAIYYGFNRPRVPTVTITTGAAMNVCVGWVLTARFGALGTAWSYAATGFAMLALMMVIFHVQHGRGARADKTTAGPAPDGGAPVPEGASASWIPA